MKNTKNNFRNILDQLTHKGDQLPVTAFLILDLREFPLTAVLIDDAAKILGNRKPRFAVRLEGEPGQAAIKCTSFVGVPHDLLPEFCAEIGSISIPQKKKTIAVSVFGVGRWPRLILNLIPREHRTLARQCGLIMPSFRPLPKAAPKPRKRGKFPRLVKR